MLVERLETASEVRRISSGNMEKNTRRSSYCMLGITKDNKIPILIRRNTFAYTWLRAWLKRSNFIRNKSIKKIFNLINQDEKNLLLSEYGDRIYEILNTGKDDYYRDRLIYLINNYKVLYNDEYDFLNSKLDKSEIDNILSNNGITIVERPKNNIYMLPGGQKRSNERIHTSIIREFKEELGLSKDVNININITGIFAIIEVYDKLLEKNFIDNLYIGSLDITSTELRKLFKPNIEVSDLVFIDVSHLKDKCNMELIKHIQKEIISK